MMWLTIFWGALLLHGISSQELQEHQEPDQKASKDSIDEYNRGRRDVIEEEKYYNIRTDKRIDNQAPQAPWLPGHGSSEDPTTKITITNSHESLPLYVTTEINTDKPTGRGARASNENWIKLPFPDQDELRNDLQPPKQSGDLINSRMPRVNFVTQNKPLDASESRNDKESIHRSRSDDLRTEFVRPEEDRDSNKPVYPRQAVYYPEERRYYDDRYYPSDNLYRRDPYLYESRYTGNGPRLDRYDEYDYVPRKPKRIIYYAHLPDVVRTPPSVDLRYRYDPYRREDDYYARTGRYDYRFRNRYPYAPLRKEERRFGYRDLAGSGTVVKDKKVEEKVTPTPILPQKEDKFKNDMNRELNRNTINSHQYHDSVDSLYLSQPAHKALNAGRADDNYLRFDGPLFQGTVEDPYQRKY